MVKKPARMGSFFLQCALPWIYDSSLFAVVGGDLLWTSFDDIETYASGKTRVKQ